LTLLLFLALIWVVQQIILDSLQVIDKYGNAYGAGTVYAANFPYTAGAFDVSFNGGSGVRWGIC
jgi:hypothetical protein